MRVISIISALCACCVLSACATDYPCGEPRTGICKSVSENYDNSYTEHVNPEDVEDPGMFGSSSSKTDDSNNKQPIKMQFKSYPQIPVDGSPLLSSPKMLRVWLTPYTDTDNIYHDQAYEYVITDKGHWLYANNRVDKTDSLNNVSLVQGSNSKSGYGSFGVAASPPKKDNTNDPAAILKDFPAINGLNHPPITTQSGINRTTTIPVQ